MTAQRVKMPSIAMRTHFTRAAKTSSALDNLVTILRDGVIRGSTRMVREGRAVVCLFDVPVRDLRILLDRRNRRRYEPFGIAIEKRYAFRAGARPAIYMRWREAESLLAPGERWRVVALELSGMHRSIGAMNGNGGLRATSRCRPGARLHWSRTGAMPTKSTIASGASRHAPE
jgi:hypothetical protein